MLTGGLMRPMKTRDNMLEVVSQTIVEIIMIAVTCQPSALPENSEEHCP